MTEDFVQSTSSQRSNPRVLRRVRPVPYESCGGVCSFLNSGCFSLCCNGQRTRRRSSVYEPRGLKKEDDLEKDELEVQLSETTKRLIKPNSQDGLTEADLYAVERGFESECSDEYQKKHHFVTSFDLELDDVPPRAESEEFLADEKVDIEDNISVLTDDTSASAADGNAKKKKKKKILNILKINKTNRKNKDGISVTSSATSLACSEVSDGQGHLDIEVESTILEKSEVSQSMKTKANDVSPEETTRQKGTILSKSFLSVFSSMRGKKGKKNVDATVKTNNDSKAEDNEVDKVIHLGLGISSKPIDTGAGDLELNTQKKPFWRTFSKKERKAKQKSNDEIVDGIKPNVENENKKNNTDVEIGTDASKIFGSGTIQNVETKKKTLLETLKLTKKEENPINQNNQQKSNEISCLLSACVNSNIKPEGERKNSTDSVEVKTIDEPDVESDENTIKIVRNEFFPAEVHPTTDRSTVSDAEGVDEMDVKEGEQDPKSTTEIQEEDKDILDKIPDSPVSAKKYEVFEKEDFSESIHTLGDEESKSNIVFNTVSELSEVIAETKDQIEEKEVTLVEGIFRTSCRLSIAGSENESKIQEEKTPVEKSVQEEVDEPKEEGDIEDVTSESHAENILSSSETLTDAVVNVTYNETSQSPEEESTNTSWIEVANVEDLSESQFSYIYKTTLRAVQNMDTVVDQGVKNVDQDVENVETAVEQDVKNVETSIDQDVKNVETAIDQDVKTEESSVLKTDAANPEFEESQNEPKLESSCDICGKSVVDESVDEAKESDEKASCVCTTLTKPRQSLTEIEEGSVKSKVDAFNKSKQPIILPLGAVDFMKKDDVMISEAHSSPTLGSKSKSATPSPIASKSRSGTLSSTNSDWQNPEEDMDRIIHSRGSLSGLGLRSDSMASVYSGAGEGRYGTVAVRGQVEFGLQYNYKAGALEIHVKQCKDLAPVDTKRNRSDPYVKVYLLPDKSKSGKRKTKVKKHTLNPVFDETLKFHISLNGLETRTLWLTVWHSDMFGRNDFLGEVMMALENKVFDDPAPVWYNLQERTEPFDDTISFKGDIIVCLKFVPPDMTVQKKGKRSRGTLHVLVKEAKYLTAYKANGTSDPFCKSYLLPDKGRNSKQKTPVVKKTVNPVWNHTFIYEDVTLQELAERCLELTVWDHDRLASNEFLGGVRFSLGTGKHYGKPVEWMDATGKELTLWKSMLERPNFWVEGCLSLRPSLDARTS